METSPLFTVEEKNAILLARFAHGESLQSVANRFGTTRKLIRQLESKYMDRFKKAHTPQGENK
jgi:DNA-directed RNA polymerase sigma subunit (sigma70/sigma32)